MIVSLAAIVHGPSAHAADAATSPDDGLAPPPEEKQDDLARRKKDGDEDEEPFRIGAIAGVGFPRPLAVEGLVKIDGVVAAGLELGFLPTTNLFGVQARMTSIAADLRVFPFRGAFFVGLRAGHQELHAETTLSAAGYSVTESATASTWFVNPRVGFLWTWQSGFTVGIDAGVHLPIGATLDSTIPSGVAPEIDRGIASTAATFGNGVTPTIDLLRVGFLF